MYYELLITFCFLTKDVRFGWSKKGQVLSRIWLTLSNRLPTHSTCYLIHLKILCTSLSLNCYNHHVNKSILLELFDQNVTFLLRLLLFLLAYTKRCRKCKWRSLSLLILVSSRYASSFILNLLLIKAGYLCWNDNSISVSCF